MRDLPMKHSPWAAIGCWIFAAFTGGLVAFAILIMVWRDYGSLLRRHALAASIVHAIIWLVYLPTFTFGMFMPLSRGDERASWVVWVAVGSVLVSWGSAAVGSLIVWKDHRRIMP